MGKLLVVGSVALDTVQTPFGQAEDVLGGSATYFSTAASYFTSVDLLAVVGEDFADQHVMFLKSRGIDLTGLERRPGDPELQLDVLRQVKRPALIACDTMNFWIERKREALWKVLEQVDVLIVNDAEARALGGHSSLVQVGKTILARGPKHLIVKRGEYGVLMFNHKQTFGAPAFPLEQAKDPTGAGDTFAGGFVGYLAATGNVSEAAFRQAVIFGSVMASFTVEAFSLDRLRVLDYKEIEARFREFKRLTHFEDLTGA